MLSVLSVFKHAFKDLCGRTCQQDLTVGAIDDKLAPGDRHMNISSAVTIAVFDCSRNGRTGAGTACERLADTSFPHAHAQVGAVYHTHELGIYPLGEDGVMFESGAQPLEFEAVDGFAENHAVRVANRETSDL